jgi:hypothetical protein
MHNGVCMVSDMTKLIKADWVQSQARMVTAHLAWKTQQEIVTVRGIEFCIFFVKGEAIYTMINIVSNKI